MHRKNSFIDEVMDAEISYPSPNLSDTMDGSSQDAAIHPFPKVLTLMLTL